MKIHTALRCTSKAIDVLARAAWQLSARASAANVTASVITAREQLRDSLTCLDQWLDDRNKDDRSLRHMCGAASPHGRYMNTEACSDPIARKSQ
jgi:hypothetical protein